MVTNMRFAKNADVTLDTTDKKECKQSWPLEMNACAFHMQLPTLCRVTGMDTGKSVRIHFVWNYQSAGVDPDMSMVT